MKDYKLRYEDGREVAIMDLPMQDILSCLATQLVPIDGTTPGPDIAGIRDRLEIELIRRRLGL